VKKRKTDFFAVRLKPAELATLDRLALETDRSKSAIVRRLIDLAETLPDARRLLGEPNPSEIQKVVA
jgi:predicted transcriptional regulator